MRYFRRPLLAGKNLKRLVTASLRGNLRRNNPDVISTVPYFPDVVSGMSLDISTQTSSTTIYLTTNIFDTILAELRAGLAVVGATAFDDGGCVGISSTTTGSDGWVRVTGGTGAAAIGFDYLAQEFRSRGGDIGSAAEGRLGQPFGTVLPNVGESFTTESVNRALGRVMANTDALYAESARCNGYMKMIATGTAGGVDALQELALPSDQKVFVDIPYSGEGIDARYLEPYFLVYDKYTNSRAQCRVTDVRSAESGNSLIGTDHVVTQNAPIVEIKNGRVLKTEGTIFNTIAQVGDFVQISGAQNVDPWSNNGAMWVIEEVIDDVHLALRPMSYMELSNYGQSDSYWDQPVVELNTRRVGTQSLGTLTISRGPYATGAVLIFSPSMPIGMDYEIWAVVPVEENDNTLGHSLGALPPVFGDGLGVMLPNGLVAHPSVEMIGSDLFVSNFDVRVNSKGYHIPDTSFLASGGFTLPAYVYFDIGMMQVWWAPAAVGGGNVLPLAYVEPSGVVHPMSRIDGWANMATVGNSGQFANLEQAFSYLTEFDATNDGVFELILLENQTPQNTNPWVVGSSKVRIRGASPYITLGPQSPDCDVFSGDGTASITLEGLTLVNIEPTTGFPGCTMQYVDIINSSGHLVIADASTTLYIGQYQQTLLSLGRVGAETHIDGSTVAVSAAGSATISGSTVDIDAVGAMTIGTTSQTHLIVGRTGYGTHILGTDVALGVMGDGSTVYVKGDNFTCRPDAYFMGRVGVVGDLYVGEPGRTTQLYASGEASFYSGQVRVLSPGDLVIGSTNSTRLYNNGQAEFYGGRINLLSSGLQLTNTVNNTWIRLDGTASFLDGGVTINAANPMFQVQGTGLFNDILIGARVSGATVLNGSLTIGVHGIAEGDVTTLYGDGRASFASGLTTINLAGLLTSSQLATNNLRVDSIYGSPGQTVSLTGSMGGGQGAVSISPEQDSYFGGNGSIFSVYYNSAIQLMMAQAPAVRVTGDTHTVGVIFAGGLLSQNSVDAVSGNGSPGVFRSIDANSAYANAPKFFGAGAELYTQYGHAYLTLRDLTTGLSYTLDDTKLSKLIGGSSSDASTLHTHSTMVALTGDQSIAGVKNFTTAQPKSSISPTASDDLVNKVYVDVKIATELGNSQGVYKCLVNWNGTVASIVNGTNLGDGESFGVTRTAVGTFSVTHPKASAYSTIMLTVIGGDGTVNICHAAAPTGGAFVVVIRNNTAMVDTSFFVLLFAGP
jgi:hypothetical protein